MNESLDVFISYRRETGADAAMALYYALKEKGYKVFIDVHTLRAGTFDDKLLRYIENARNVLVVLTAGSLDRCANADDWLRREVEYAFEKGCRVIPVMKPDFRFPPGTSLPEKLRALPRHHGIPYSHDLFDGTLDQICRFLGGPTPPPVDFVLPRAADVVASSKSVIQSKTSEYTQEKRMEDRKRVIRHICGFLCGAVFSWWMWVKTFSIFLIVPSIPVSIMLLSMPFAGGYLIGIILCGIVYGDVR